jgi:hypothetical protein
MTERTGECLRVDDEWKRCQEIGHQLLECSCHVLEIGGVEGDLNGRYER